jgi:ParB-like chromosome segregation protein Spo0J
MPHLKERWLSVAMRCQAGRSLPPVELVLVDGCYYVVDGHHRVSVARALRLDAIDAYVIELACGN